MEITVTSKLISNLKNFLISIIIFLALILIIYNTMDNKPEEKTLRMGAVTLNVANLEVQKDFYHGLLDLEIIEEKENYLSLGHGDKAVVNLVQKTDLEFQPYTANGLYHTAIVYPSRAKLASVLNTTLDGASELFSGSSDHKVTEAFYFNDPEGNGVEIYFDKPRSEVTYVDGKPEMGGSYLDTELYIRQYLGKEENEELIKMGHMHLKIGDIETAKKFYIDILNFDIMSEMPNALFISRDNYHHHIGMNTWNSLGSTARVPENEYGLYRFDINILNKSEFEKIKTNIKNSDYAFEEISDSEIKVNDPWNNTVVISF
jgi:catechol 2,3-dioxygenase